MVGCRRGINRNIVECKVIFSFKRMSDGAGINRNIVECKEFNANESANLLDAY